MTTSHSSDTVAVGAEAAAPARAVAVIDIGTTSVRMAIAEINAAGQIRILDRLFQAVALGKDTFTKGAIRKSTIEECVHVLRSYRQILKEYQITQPDQVRVVATSAVREAENRLAFVDRIYSATGFQVEVIDEAEVNRITYLGIQPYLKSHQAFAEATTIVTEVGGGSTELLLVRGVDVLYSHTYRLGTLRLREALEAYGAPKGKSRKIIESQIEMTVEQIVAHVPQGPPVELIALGADVRFAARQLMPGSDSYDLIQLPVAALSRFAQKMMSLSEDELVKKYHLSFPDAETLGPALLAYVRLAEALKLEHLYVAHVNMRMGLLQEMATRGAWTEDFIRQIIRSALELGRKFQFAEDHAQHVAELCSRLFAVLKDEHQLEPRYGILLHVAALLHEIGLFISTASHHKHSMYLINHSELFGLSRTDVLLVALVARYHRRASPKPAHAGYAALDRERRVAVSKMAAILRVADALDSSHSQRIRDIQCARENGRLVITVPGVDDLSIEQMALKQKGSLFEETFGMSVLLRQGPPR